MEIKDIRKSYSQIEELLNKQRVKESLDILAQNARASQVSLLIDEVYSLEQSYKRMVEFLLYSSNDPQKATPYNALILNIKQLSDQINSELSAAYFRKTYPNIYSNDIKTEVIEHIYNELTTEYTNSDKAFLLMREECLNNFFNAIAFSAYTSNNAIENIKNVFETNSFTDNERLVLVSSLYFSLMNYFDERKITIICNLVANSNYAIAARASVVLVTVMIKYDSRIQQYPNLQNSINTLKADQKYETRFKNIFTQFLNAKQTEKISHKFTNEILPEMIKINPIIRKKLDLDNLISDKNSDESMPDWEDLIINSPELEEKIDQIHKLQQEGFDLLSTTFKNLKSFPFFNTISNWFVPFSKKNSYVTTLITIHGNGEFNQLISFLNSIPNVCNSDKYSMLFAMEVMPILYKDMVNKIPNDAFLDEDNERVESTLNIEAEFKNHTNLYIQDIYRFQTAYPNRNSFENIFDLEFDFQNNTTAKSLVQTSTLLRELGHYYFKNQEYKNVAEIYHEYLVSNEPNVDILQKIGFAYQQLNNYSSALNYYLQADLFDKNREWNNKKIALCYRNLNQPQKALEYYLIAGSENPDNLHTQASIGQCYIELQNHEEALKFYFKVEYLDPKNNKIWKPIAWCSYVLGKFDVSEKYYKKISDSDNATELDIMSYGNLLLVMGKKREAILMYKRSITPKFSLQNFIENINHEAGYLKKHNIDDIEIATLLDELRYMLEE